MKRISLSILLIIACAALAVPQGKIKQTPPALTAALHYKKPTTLPLSITLETFIGPVEITEPLLIELLHHPVVTRMKEIDQHGPPTYFGNYPTFSRYDHCIGVLALLKKVNRPLVEQVAGLLHDASHTVFSHVADHLFKASSSHAYQDTIHDWYLTKMGLDNLLARYDLTVENINPDQPAFSALEQPRPHLCADRLQYILYTGLVHKRINQEQLMEIVSSLNFIDENWIITNQEHARTLGDLACYFTQHYWQSPENFAWTHWLCQALRQAIALEMISSDDIHFGTDAAALELLRNSSDPQIKTALAACSNWQEHCHIVKPGQEYDNLYHPKVMIIDPLVQTSEEKTARPLMQRDDEYREQIVALKQKLSSGIRLQFK